MGETQDAGQTGPEAVTDDVDVSAEIVHDADVSAEAADEDWEAQAAVVDPDGAADDPDDSDDPDDDEIDEASRVTTWISERAIAASGRFRQTAAEL
ncbi:MAG TPA: HAD-IB family hydrolase, partial [Gordonia sp. (in: high G+C Gram-positive bacteria)]|nr:HAD-IB family hydrolase [Gordonia sp. (in: high G+C Gram-positive bacteria)]